MSKNEDVAFFSGLVSMSVDAQMEQSDRAHDLVCEILADVSAETGSKAIAVVYNSHDNDDVVNREAVLEHA